MAKEAKVEAPKAQPQVETDEGKKAEVVEYPTATARAIKVGEQVYDQLDFLVVIYNKLLKLEKAVC